MSAIRFDHVSKIFTLHRERSRSFQELFLNLSRGRWSFPKEKFWALRDVSFEIEPGETVALVGANGAGKSTALKLMSRIIEPTSGQVEIDGQVGALLELGAGFHPDLTGRENIYLNGSILGFSRAKMDRIFDDILDFSEMERFIDMPVKHYSSGMYMRLAFAIAIHLDPEILLVDEVLAVGDQAFQYRCLDKINEMKRQGVTIVLVTHTLDSVRKLCERAIWLDDGQVQDDGPVERVLELYVEQVLAEDEDQILEDERKALEAESEEAKDEDETPWRYGSREAEIVRVQLLNDQGQETRAFKTGDTFIARMHYVAHQPISHPNLGLAIYHSSGFHIYGPNNILGNCPIPVIDGPGFVEYTIKSLPLLPGTYLLTVAIHDYEGQHAYDHIHQQFAFRVRAGGKHEALGSFYIPGTWRWSEEAKV